MTHRTSGAKANESAEMSVEVESVELDLDDARGCDFCACPAVTAFASKPLSVSQTVTHVDGTAVDLVSRNEGEWLACAPCERLIERERYDRLADRNRSLFRRRLVASLTYSSRNRGSTACPQMSQLGDKRETLRVDPGHDQDSPDEEQPHHTFEYDGRRVIDLFRTRTREV
jgi:hypothetical protein